MKYFSRWPFSKSTSCSSGLAKVLSSTVTKSGSLLLTRRKWNVRTFAFSHLYNQQQVLWQQRQLNTHKAGNLLLLSKAHLSKDENSTPSFRCGTRAYSFFLRFDLWWPLRHFQTPQLLHLNTEIVTKRGFSVFWWWLCTEILPYFERPFRSLKTPKKILHAYSQKLSRSAIRVFQHSAYDVAEPEANGNVRACEFRFCPDQVTSRPVLPRANNWRSLLIT